MEVSDFIKPNVLIADILLYANDVELRSGISLGWYRSQVQSASEELAIDSFYQIITEDLDMPKTTLAMEIPKGCFNVRELYGWSGACCSPESSQVIWWKRNYNNKGGNGMGYTSRVKEGNTTGTDPFILPYYPGERAFWANIQDGKIMFSSSCIAFDKVRIVFNGMGVDIGDEPVIPRFLRQAIIDYVILKFYTVMKSREPRIYRTLWIDANNTLNNQQNGSWKKAKMRISSMSSWERTSMYEYYGRLNY